jgi:Uma2 family endonuclease
LGALSTAWHEQVAKPERIATSDRMVRCRWRKMGIDGATLMISNPSPSTADQLMAMGEDAPFELIRGELRQVSPTDAGHWITCGLFAMEFTRYVDRGHPGLVLVGEGGFLASRDPDTVIAPDVAFIHAHRLRELGDRRKYSTVPPDAAVEALSPSNTRREIAEKVRLYLAGGVRLVLVADSISKTIAAHTADGRVRVFRVGDDLDGEDVLPGFLVPVAKFFE